MTAHLIAPPEPAHWTDWAYLTPSEHGREAFTADECDLWLDLADCRASRPGMTGPDGALTPDIRAVDVVDLELCDDTAWIYDKLARIAAGVNAAHWQLDLTHLANIEVLRYQPGGHYVEHVDWCDRNQTRKVSLVVKLSDTDDYEGGDLLIRTKQQPMPTPRERGSVTIFPAWTLHAVTPVTAGVRRTATAWVQGPKFR